MFPFDDVIMQIQFPCQLAVTELLSSVKVPVNSAYDPLWPSLQKSNSKKTCGHKGPCLNKHTQSLVIVDLKNEIPQVQGILGPVF